MDEKGNVLMKKTIAAAAALIMLIGLAACGSSNADSSGADKAAVSQKTTETPKPVDLTGHWKQTNSNSQDEWMEADITGGTIEINWMQKDQKSLYWKGSYTAPTKPGSAYSWTSQGDTKTMSESLMASQDKTKDFKYAGNQLTYEQSALGTTMTVKMDKQ